VSDRHAIARALVAATVDAGAFRLRDHGVIR
jgi:hypothetical protein